MSSDLRKAGIKKKKGKITSYIKSDLLIRHKESKIEYTVNKVLVHDNEPVIVAYRYYSKPGENKKVKIQIPLKDFKKYEAV